MIVVALLAAVCGYVGWQAKTVRARFAMRDEINRMGGDAGVLNAIVDDPDRTIPWIRTLLGDKAIETIELPITVSREYRDRLRAMFPEVRRLLALRPTPDRGYALDLFPEDQPPP